VKDDFSSTDHAFSSVEDDISSAKLKIRASQLTGCRTLAATSAVPMEFNALFP